MSTVQSLMPAGYASRVAATGLANGVASALCAAVALPLLVSTLGLARYGEWAVLGMFITAAAALDLGISRAIVLHCAGQTSARVRESATAAALIVLCVALLAVMLIVIASTATGKMLGVAAMPLDRGILAGGCIILTLSMMNGVLRAVLESQLAVHWVNVGFLAQTVFFYGLTLAAALFWRGGVVIATTAAFAVVMLLHAAMLARAGLLRPLRPTGATLRAMLRTGRGSYLLAAPTALLPPLASMLVLSQATDSGAYGIFDLGFRIATLASTLLASIAVPMLALAARVHATGAGTTQLHDWVRRYLQTGWTLYALGIATFWLAGPWLSGRLFPAAGAALFPVALALLAGMGAIAASESATRAILGSAHPRAVLVARLVLLGVVLIPGTWLLNDGGIAAFAGTYIVAGWLYAAIVTFAWWRNRAICNRVG